MKSSGAAEAAKTPAAASKAMEGRNAATLETGGRRSAPGGWPMEPACAKVMTTAKVVESGKAAALEARGRRNAAGAQAWRRRAAVNMVRSAGMPNADAMASMSPD